MLIFIENTPRAYAWGSSEALAEMLGRAPSGAPEAELWLGDHPGSPANVAKAAGTSLTLIDLIASDPERYGVRGGPLPFLTKLLAIGAPLSLQVHPNLEQARAGFAAEEAAGIPRDAANRNYRDPNHKPELLVALTEVRALSGFRPLNQVGADLATLITVASEHAAQLTTPAEHTAAAELRSGIELLEVLHEHLSRTQRTDAEFRAWLLEVMQHDPRVPLAITAVRAAAEAGSGSTLDAALASGRAQVLRELLQAYPSDPGVLVSLLLHLLVLEPGQAIFLRAGQLHAYLSGVGVEVMAASDNVLRAGLTSKHVDIAELCRIVDTNDLSDPYLPGIAIAPGVTVWRPEVEDFQLFRARLCPAPEEWDDPPTEPMPRAIECPASEIEIAAEYPLVLVVTDGRVRVDRPDGEISEVANVRRGQSLYVSAGEPIRLTGSGEAYLATVGVAGTSAG
ncbi:mannose-6-phosphate isomerase, class I [Leucobacter sp. 1207-22]|uniref:mannose-6-phosphate isomerase, class I n=1 Tax=Leucobacter sp. 1207-22 TaxID=2604456 RepID=UPI0040627C86